jgi:hypothetical protein
MLAGLMPRCLDLKAPTLVPVLQLRPGAPDRECG